MGFLDHSTNNIIVDAVLTDEGRKLLARNDGSFRITMFSMGDDEVDYGIIKKFGRAVGKEKIAKNTPVFEAQTKKDIAIKHRLLTLPSRTLRQMPTYTMAPPGTLTYNTTNNSENSFTISQGIPGAPRSRVPDGLIDNTFTVLIPDRFLKITEGSAGFVSMTSDTRVATYKAIGTVNENGGSQLTLTVALQNNFSQTVFNIYGRSSTGNTAISSVITIVGDQSGSRTDINVSISNS